MRPVKLWEVPPGTFNIGTDGRPIGRVIHRREIFAGCEEVAARCLASIEPGTAWIPPALGQRDRGRATGVVTVLWFEHNGEMVPNA